MIAQAAQGTCGSGNLPQWLTMCPYEFPTITLLLGLVAGVVIGKMCRCKCRASGGEGSDEDGIPFDKDCVEIYVGNLSYDMTEDQMRKEFEKYGEVRSARIITNRMSHRSKGFGFVEMPNRPEAEAAIAGLHDKDILGRKLRVNEAKNKSRE
jgi:hypothetical protein